MTMLRRVLAPLIAFILAVAPIADAPALTPGQAAAIRSGAGWAAQGSSLDLFFSRNGGSCAVNRFPASCSILSDSRGSSGYGQTQAGTLTSFGSNVPRVTNLGWTNEPAGTNLVLQSQNFGTSWGSLVGVSVSQTGNAPDGTATAWKLSESASGASARELQTSGAITITSGSTYTLSAFMQAGTLGFGQIALVSGSDAFYATANLSTGAITQAAASGLGTFTSSSITPLINGWYRVTVTGSLPDTTATARLILTNTGAGGFAPSYTGTGTGNISIWGAQLENKGAATSYIATTTASVTRAADAGSVPVGNVSRIVFTFSDGTTQTVTGVTPHSNYSVPTNLNKPVIARMTGYPT